MVASVSAIRQIFEGKVSHLTRLENVHLPDLMGRSFRWSWFCHEWVALFNQKVKPHMRPLASCRQTDRSNSSNNTKQSCQHLTINRLISLCASMQLLHPELSSSLSMQPSRLWAHPWCLHWWLNPNSEFRMDFNLFAKFTEHYIPVSGINALSCWCSTLCLLLIDRLCICNKNQVQWVALNAFLQSLFFGLLLVYWSF